MTETFKRKNLFQLTLPLFLFGLMTIGVTFADTMLLSNYSDNLAAAVSMANQILGIGYDLSGLMSIGALILISQYLGRGDLENAKNIARIGFIASVIFGMLIAAILSGGATFYADWINTPPEIYGDVLIYVYSISVGFIFYGFVTTALAALRGFGKTLEILLIGFVGNVVYLLFEYVLIYGVWIFPELGIYGAALSTILIRGINVLLLIWLLQWRLGLDVFKVPPGLWRQTKKILKLSYPSVSEALGYQLYQLFLVSLIAGIGVTAVLTRSYSLTITQLLAMIVLVISYGNEVLIGYDKGAGDHKIAFRRALKTAVITGFTVMLFGLLIAVFGKFFLELFTRDQAIVSAAEEILYLHIFSIPFQAINLILFNSLKAVGDVNRPVIVNLSITFAIALPLAWLFVSVMDMGVKGLWYGYIIEEIVKATSMFLLWRYRNWQRLKIIEDPAAAAV
ncbi:MATE family efflux transporter [Sneathiella sp.]|uniref:MATE family efflux transporter n=1 Tax=Sneathiella sp. TaxID=1964365 RepID=UPI0026028DE6|nr:MATE family efflux transporter [Sneathiella sp.]MDF2368651.1 MATE family efflux transporter [Sneathiella sp.]